MGNRFAVMTLGRELVVRMQWIVIAGHASEKDHVRFSDCARRTGPQGTDFQIFQKQALHHSRSFPSARASVLTFRGVRFPLWRIIRWLVRQCHVELIPVSLLTQAEPGRWDGRSSKTFQRPIVSTGNSSMATPNTYFTESAHIVTLQTLRREVRQAVHEDRG